MKKSKPAVVFENELEYWREQKKVYMCRGKKEKSWHKQ